MTGFFDPVDLLLSLVAPRKGYDPSRGLASRSADAPEEEQASRMATGDHMIPRIGDASAVRPNRSDSASAQDPQQPASWPFGIGAHPLGVARDVDGLLPRNGLSLGDPSGVVDSAVGGLQDISKKLSGGLADVAAGVGDLGASTRDFLSKLFGGAASGGTEQAAAPPQVAEPPLNLLSPGVATNAAVLNPQAGGMSAGNDAAGGERDGGGLMAQDQRFPDDAQGTTASKPQAPDDNRRVSSRFDRRAQTGDGSAPQAAHPATATASTRQQLQHQQSGPVIGAQSGNANRAMDYLMRKGVSRDDAAALVWNFQQETGPNINTTTSHDGDTGFGIAGFRDPTPGQGRWSDLKRFAASQGRDPADLYTQLDFVMHELHGSEKRAWNKITAADTPEKEAAAAISYFRPAKEYAENRASRASEVRQLLK